MTDLHTAAKLALEALVRADRISGYPNNKNTITALREALAEQPAQQRHISYVCPQCYWSLDEQPAQQKPVECQYGKGGYACCEGGPCKADEQNNAPKQAQQEPVVWMYVNRSTHETIFQRHMRSFVDHGNWTETPLYSEPLANHELNCVCGAVWCGDEMVHLPHKSTPPQRQPLTDEEIDEIWRTHLHRDSRVRAIEAAHGITKENT
jgi:hypothetical protein